MKKVLFLDRDGTILHEPEDEQIDSLGKMKFLPNVISSLSDIYKSLDYELVMVTNQDGLGTSSFPEEQFWPVQNIMLSVLESEGVIFDGIFIDRTFPDENAPTRKPGTALLTKYLAAGIDMSSSFVIGDRLSDAELAENLGCSSIIIGHHKTGSTVLNAAGWNEIRDFLRNRPRKALLTRKTSETSVEVEVNLDGTGISDISTGVGFFDHLLDQIPKHSSIDIRISAEGDLHVDEHHTVEDVGIALGSALAAALGKKKGIERYGFLLPMDDCLAQVAIDLGGRALLRWDVTFGREKIGDLPTEMFSHFFRSFSDSAKCNLNIKADGENEHHKIESIFKAFSRSLKMAVRNSGSNLIPSSKGTI